MVNLCNARSGVHRFLYLPTFRCPYRNASRRTSAHISHSVGTASRHQELTGSRSYGNVRKLFEARYRNASWRTWPHISHLVGRNIGPGSRHQEFTWSRSYSNVRKMLEARLPLKTASKPGKTIKVTVLGAAGRVGEALSLMLKQSPYIDQLALHDLYSTRGIALDLSFLDTKCEVFSYCGKDDLEEALKDANVVVIAAGVPFKENRPDSKRFSGNAEVVAELTEACAKTCPEALIALLTAPVNSTVPVACETVKRVLPGVGSPTRIFGVTTLDVVYANTYMAQHLQVDPEEVRVPVIGGSSGDTTVPVFSQTCPQSELNVSDAHYMTKLVRCGVAEALADKPSSCLPTMTLAFAAARFTISLCKACMGHPDIVECSYVPVCNQDTPPYLANPVEISAQGIQRSLGIPQLSMYEKCVLDRSTEYLKEDIDRGINFIATASSAPLPSADKKTESAQIMLKK